MRFLRRRPKTRPRHPRRSLVKKPEDVPDYSLKVNVPLVNVDVLVTTKDGQFVPGLKQGNFRVMEDGVPQTVTHFNVSKAPITAVLLVEFASTRYSFMINALQASYAFANTLTKDDWIAVSYYDMQPHILVDFTQDKKAVYGALNQLRIPGFAETNLFDALYDTLDRLDRVEGKKYVILMTTGYDSFSKLTLDKITKKIKDTKDVTIFPISVGQIARIMGHAGNRGMGIHASELDYLQADNEMRTFAAMTGGRAYFPRFEARVWRGLSGYRQRHPQPVHALLCSHQREARWNLSQAESSGRGARRRSAEGEGPEGQGREDRSGLARRVHGETYGGLNQFSTQYLVPRNGAVSQQYKVPSLG